MEADYHDTIRTIIFTGRPLRIRKNDFVMDWEENKQNEIKELTSKGILPIAKVQDDKKKAGEEFTFQETMQMTPLLMGQASGAIDDVLPCSEIMDEMMAGAIATMRRTLGSVVKVDAVVENAARL